MDKYKPDAMGIIRVPPGTMQFYADQLIHSLQNDLGKYTIVSNLGFEIKISAENVQTVTIVEHDS